MTRTITTAQWQAELERAMRASRHSDEGVTVREIREQSIQAGQPQSILAIREALRRIPGLIVGRRMITDLMGRETSVVCYRLAPVAKKAAKRR